MSEQAAAEIVEFRSGDGLVSLRVALRDSDAWVTREQMGTLYNGAPQNIGYHLNNGLKTGEITEDSRRKESFRDSSGRLHEVTLYNLDAIIWVGFRVHSKRGVEFRKWATRVLRGELAGRRVAPVPAPVPAVDLEALATRIADVLDQRFARHVKQIQAESGLTASYIRVHGVISARSYRELCAMRNRIAEVESEIAILEGATDKNRAKRAALGRVHALIRETTGHGYAPRQPLRLTPADKEYKVFGVLREREFTALDELTKLKQARQQKLDFEKN